MNINESFSDFSGGKTSILVEKLERQGGALSDLTGEAKA